MNRKHQLSHHDDSPDLFRRLEECRSRLATDFVGICFRTAAYKRANQRDLISGRGSAIHGGRWNPPGLPTVYLSADLITATEEYLQTNRRAGLPDEAALPKVDVGVTCAMDRVLDLTRADVRRCVGISEEQILGVRVLEPTGVEVITQAIGRLAVEVCFQGLLVPSAARPGARNVVVFPGKLSKRLAIVNRERLPQRPPRLKADRKTF
ncbi:RES domain protein [Aquisphaera giovannonii]|uniref:RES domain protein n=1 Tax=Aquisphaera giovannonii TaxID=406548 RepID=A0A5B9VWD4_9BACT|nr:RES domain-containing protein [Aquisphaera giovannonii]QEH32257.1 RES domain protein [Aquisphaera giovannonii]